MSTDSCFHAGEESDPVALEVRVRDAHIRLDKQDRKWEELTGPQGALTLLVERLTRVEVKVAIYAGIAAAIGTALGSGAFALLRAMLVPAARAAGAP